MLEPKSSLGHVFDSSLSAKVQKYRYVTVSGIE